MSERINDTFGGTISVISGCMFSGKTEELIRQTRRLEIAGYHVQIVKPQIDDRFGAVQQVVSHCGQEKDAIPVEKPAHILEVLRPDTRVLAIDEVQFFPPEIVAVVKRLLLKNIQVIVAGLPTNFRGEPFGSMPELLALADQVTFLKAVCTYEENGKRCGRDATRTQRIINAKPANYHDPEVLVGGQESYEARCDAHHSVPGKPEPII